MSSATATPPLLGETGGTLQEKLRALSARVLFQARVEASASSSTGSSSFAQKLSPEDAKRAVTQLQRRGLEVLLRFDDHVHVAADIGSEQRREQNALRLGTAALSMRTKGEWASADLLEKAHDLFVQRRRDGCEDSCYSSDTTLALLLTLANANTHVKADGCSNKKHPESHTSRRVERASRWLKITPPAAFEETPSGFGAFASGASSVSFGEYGTLHSAISQKNTASNPNPNPNPGGFTAPPRLDVMPSLGGLGVASDPRRTRKPLGALRMRKDESESGARDEHENEHVTPNDDVTSRSLFGALRRARVPVRFDKNDDLAIRVALGDTKPDPNAFLFAEDDLENGQQTNGQSDVSVNSTKKANSAPAARKTNVRDNSVSGTNPPGLSRVRCTTKRTEGDYPGNAKETTQTDPWLAAIDSPDALDTPSACVFGWDLGSGAETRHACDAFLAGGEDAFGDAYGHLVRPTCSIFGAAVPARATQDELVQATRRALAGGRAVTQALAPRLLRHDAPRSAGDPPPLRLPCASAGSVQGALAALAEAANDRAALDTFVRGIETDVDESGPADLATQATAATARDVLRAHDAALLGLPAATAARRADELAHDETGPVGSQLAFPYRIKTSSASVPDVTLLEARAHTKALRTQLATLRALCAPVDGDVSGIATLRRVFATLTSGGARDIRERNLLRALASAAAAPALAQARAWVRGARLDDPRGEFFIKVSGGWGACVNELSFAGPEMRVQEWRARALRLGTSTGIDDDLETREALEDARNAAKNETIDLRSVPPWRGGAPGQNGSGVVKNERAQLRDFEEGSSNAHPLFTGVVPRDALATGVHLRILHRLPQTRGFAAEMAALDEDAVVSGTSYEPWTLAFDSDDLAAATKRRTETRVKMELAALRATRLMAATRDAERARGETRRRAIRAAATATRLEKETALQTAKEVVLEDFALRMASLASRRAREAFARRDRLDGNGNGEGDETSRESNERNDEQTIQKALNAALSATTRWAPGTETPVSLTKALAMAFRGGSDLSAESRSAESPSIGMSPDSFWKGADEDERAASVAKEQDVSALFVDDSIDDLETSFRTARDVSITDVSVDMDAPTTPGPVVGGLASSPSRDTKRVGEVSASANAAAESSSPPSAPVSPYPDSQGDDSSFSSHDTSNPGGSTEPETPVVTTKHVRVASHACTGTPNRAVFSTRHVPSVSPTPPRVADTKTRDTRDSGTVTSLPLETPFPVITQTCVSGPIRDRLVVFSKLVAETFVEHLGLEHHVEAVGKYVLCGAGDFASALLERVSFLASAGVVGGGWGVTAPGGAADALDGALRASSAMNDPLAQRFRIAVRVPSTPHAAPETTYSGIRNPTFSEHNLGMVDFLHASYALEWPLASLFPSATRETLAMTHRQLTRFRHARAALSEAHRLVQNAGLETVSAYKNGGDRGLAGAALAKRRLRRLSLLSHELRHFVSCVEGYCGEACHGSAKLALRLALRENGTHRVKPKDAYAIRDVLGTFAETCAAFCFLRPRDAPLREAIDVALQLALDFRKHVRHSKSLLTDGVAYAACQATHATFKIHVKRLCVRLADAASNAGGSLGGVSPKRARDLLFRIDHNGFYGSQVGDTTG